MKQLALVLFVLLTACAPAAVAPTPTLAPSPTPEPVVIESVECSDLGDHMVGVSGAVQNNTGEPYAFVKVFLRVLNQGEVVATHGMYLTRTPYAIGKFSLQPGETASWDQGILQNVPIFDACELEIVDYG